MAKSGRIWYLATLGAGLVLIVAIVIALGPGGGPLDLAMRAAAMLGLVGVFFAALSSVFMRDLTRFFGTPFIRLHHYVVVTSLILLTAHPLGVALRRGSLAVFVPDVRSWAGFFINGGRPAWYLLGVAALVGLAAVRRRLPKSWRAIHMLNYVAFGFGAIHAWLLGSDFQGTFGRVVLVAMAVLLGGAFIQKRRQIARVAAQRRRRRDAS